MKNLRLFFFAGFLGCFIPVLSYAQGVFIPPRTVTGTVNGITRPIPGATVTVCAANRGGTPCSPPLTNTVFQDSGLTIPLSNPFTTDANGNYPQAALAAGTYTITESVPGFVGFSYQATVSCSTAGGCTISGPFTVNGAATVTGALVAGSISVSGGLSATGTLNCKNINGVRCVATGNPQAWSGADWTNWINSAISDLGGTGVVDARGLTGSPGTGATTIAIPNGVQVWWPANFLTTSASPGVTLAGFGSSLIGAGRDASKITCSANNVKCIDLLGSSTSRGSVVKDISITTTTGTSGDAIALEDNIGDVSIENIQIRPAGTCWHFIPGAQGELLVNLKQVRCDAPGAANAAQMDMSGGTAWTTVNMDNVYITAGPTVGMNMANIEVNFTGGSVDNTPTGFVIGGTTRFTGGHCENASSVCFSILGSGTTTLASPFCIGAAQCVSVNAANANTLITEPRSSATTGANDITYSGASTGNHVLIGGGLLSKLIAVTSPAVLYQIQGNNIKTYNGSTTLTNSGAVPAVVISGSGNANNQGLSIIDTDASGHRWDFSEAFAVGTLSLRDRTQSGQPAWSFKVTGTSANQGILSHAITGDRTWVHMDDSLTLVGTKCAISQKAETGADASLLSCTPLSVVGTYRVCISMAVSAQNTATLGWTATWTDSNGSAQAPTNLSLFQTGVAAPALTFTAATNGNYYGCLDLDTNNAGTAIVAKTTFSGTSIAYKASVTIERVQ